MRVIHALGGNALLLATLLEAGPVWGAPQLELLYAFKGAPDGSYADAPPTIGPNGVLFGTTSSGGTGSGTVYELTPPTAGQGNWTETILSTLGGGEGKSPDGRITLMGDKLFGTARSRGHYNGGTVFQLRPPANGSSAWRLTTLHSFNKSVDGRNPEGAVIFDGSRVLYGGTTRGKPLGQGDVFRLSPPASHGSGWSETLLHDVGLGSDLVPDAHGGFYQSDPTATVLYDLAKSSAGTWAATVIYATGTPACVIGHLVANSAGSMFAVLSCNAARQPAPSITEFVPPTLGTSAWTTQVIYTPPPGISAIERQDLVADASGALYCATPSGGPSFGTIFKLSPPAGGTTAWVTTTLFTFTKSAKVLPPGSGISVNSEGDLFFATTGYMVESAVYELTIN